MPPFIMTQPHVILPNHYNHLGIMAPAWEVASSMPQDKLASKA